MVFLYILLTVYIIAVNFYGYRFLKQQRDNIDEGNCPGGDGKLYLTAFIGGAPGEFLGMFIMRYRLTSLALMIFLPLLSVFNFYCFYLAYRSIWLFI